MPYMSMRTASYWGCILFSFLRTLSYLWRDFFSSGATFFLWRDFFFSGATFFRWRDFFLWLNFLVLETAARFIAGSSHEHE